MAAPKKPFLTLFFNSTLPDYVQHFLFGTKFQKKVKVADKLLLTQELEYVTLWLFVSEKEICPRGCFFEAAILQEALLLVLTHFPLSHFTLVHIRGGAVVALRGFGGYVLFASAKDSRSPSDRRGRGRRRP